MVADMDQMSRSDGSICVIYSQIIYTVICDLVYAVVLTE